MMIMKKISCVLLVLFIAVGMVGCGSKNEKEDSSLDNMGETQTPEDNREGVETLDKYPGDWGFIKFKDGKGYLDAKYLEEYADSGVTIEIMFYLVKNDYFLLGFNNASKLEEKLYCVDNSYISGIARQKDSFDDKKMPLQYVYLQDDGFVAFNAVGCWNAGYDYNCYSFSVDLSADAIKHLCKGKSNDRGLAFQTYGVQVTKVLINTGRVDTTIRTK